ncbi:TadE/TadG family type IV pilus assembly protein [Rhodanobacter sp. BL-MT-08]
MNIAIRSVSAVYAANASVGTKGRGCVAATRYRQRGVMAIEYALVFVFGLLPLLLLTISGVLIFAAKQSLTLAADNGARAALQYSASSAARQATACAVAEQSMQWLLNFSGDTPDCSDAPIAVSTIACPSNASLSCVQVVTSFNYAAHPFIPGTQAVYKGLLDSISSSAIVQLDSTGP